MQSQLTPEHSHQGWSIRAARAADAKSLVSLCEQLGYPVELGDLETRLSELLKMNTHLILVAVDEDKHIRGWVHAFERPLLMTAPAAEVGGLVVDRSWRRSGLGKALLSGVVEWANRHGLKGVNIRSNVKRTSAHEFYLANDFEFVKESLTFHKVL